MKRKPWASLRSTWPSARWVYTFITMSAQIVISAVSLRAGWLGLASSTAWIISRGTARCKASTTLWPLICHARPRPDDGARPPAGPIYPARARFSARAQEVQPDEITCFLGLGLFLHVAVDLAQAQANGSLDAMPAVLDVIDTVTQADAHRGE